MSEGSASEREVQDAAAEARLRALSSPLRLRVLRLCAFESRTNKELAELLGVNPGTMLHHVRTLVQTEFLVAEPERAGGRGAREVPYRATGLSWRTPMKDQNRVLVETFLQQIDGLAEDEMDTVWLGLRLNAEHKAELDERLSRLVTEFKERGPDEDGTAYSLFAAVHVDRNPPRGTSGL
ncbi:transcriptional regulator [Microbacterium sp. C7(2022)]|uniref:ArsR/SmtB family transcription factor n=1 Tax=Microbacterium sp. C7(2022) TaxID=2992759 RepID=UPI00237A533F|nr:winged helix-turn-helix domain-containing protein [Microbacterium sp. C7(2022)]MDE0546490.1 winged helix-turn-helix domain-containing protein [Microbacterium sp. C7(2022)]